MSFADSSTYYNVLDLRPDSSPQEVREAYLAAMGFSAQPLTEP